MNKMIRSNIFKDSSEKLVKKIERLSESEREIENNQEEDEDSDEVIETEKITRNSVTDHVKIQHLGVGRKKEKEEK